MNRRTFVRRASGLSLLGLGSVGCEDANAALPKVTVKALTRGPKHHFFGYYAIPPWNQSGKYLVCLESAFQDHMPSVDESAAVGLVDPRTGAFTKVAETRAWNFQQGAMLHWNPLQAEREVIFNDRKNNDVLAAVLDVESGRKNYLSRPVSAVSRKNKYALSLTYGRLTRLRKVVGYPGLADPYPDDPHPEKDGVFLLDLKTGTSKLVVSIAEVYQRLVKKHPDLKDRHMWFNHTVFNPDASRFLFLARTWNTSGTTRRLESAMFTANRDGSDLRQVIPFQMGLSHFDWRSPTEIIATFPFNGTKTRHVLFTDGQDDYQVVGEDFFAGDGHCTFAPDGKWLASDPGDSKIGGRTLLLYNVATQERLKVGSYPLKEYLSGDLRCDLHPRWSRAGDALCFDALESDQWTRQLHIASLEFSK